MRTRCLDLSMGQVRSSPRACFWMHWSQKTWPHGRERGRWVFSPYPQQQMLHSNTEASDIIDCLTDLLQGGCLLPLVWKETEASELLLLARRKWHLQCRDLGKSEIHRIFGLYFCRNSAKIYLNYQFRVNFSPRLDVRQS